MLGSPAACALFCSALFPYIPLADRPADKSADHIKGPESAHPASRFSYTETARLKSFLLALGISGQTCGLWRVLLTRCCCCC